MTHKLSYSDIIIYEEIESRSRGSISKLMQELTTKQEEKYRNQQQI